VKGPRPVRDYRASGLLQFGQSANRSIVVASGAPGGFSLAALCAAPRLLAPDVNHGDEAPHSRGGAYPLGAPLQISNPHLPLPLPGLSLAASLPPS
jgi:hypothetical protein